MNIARIVSAAGLLFAAAALAQDANPYNGTWRAEFESEQGAAREGTIVVKDQGGTWDMALRGRNNPCAGRAAPITVRSATADDLVFEINRSAALPGCKDGLAKFKRVDDKTLQGEFDGGRKIKLLRQ